jgi:hypothetical protein
MVEMIREWSKELVEDLHGRIAHRFARPEPRRRALSYLKGLTGALERKNGWQLASWPSKPARLRPTASRGS